MQVLLRWKESNACPISMEARQTFYSRSSPRLEFTYPADWTRTINTLTRPPKPFQMVWYVTTFHRFFRAGVWPFAISSSSFFKGYGGQFNYFGLWINETFETGHSKAKPLSTTYNSPQLSMNEEFKVARVEAWCLLEPVMDPNREAPQKVIGEFFFIHSFIHYDLTRASFC